MKSKFKVAENRFTGKKRKAWNRLLGMTKLPGGLYVALHKVCKTRVGRQKEVAVRKLLPFMK